MNIPRWLKFMFEGISALGTVITIGKLLWANGLLTWFNNGWHFAAVGFSLMFVVLTVALIVEWLNNKFKALEDHIKTEAQARADHIRMESEGRVAQIKLEAEARAKADQELRDLLRK